MLIGLSILLAYLLGAIPVGLLVARQFGINDIREHGSGNIGATNVTRVLGFKAAIWVYLGDMGKGVLTVSLARLLTGSIGALDADLFLVLVGLVTMLGNIFPVYLRFRGGKGVNVAFGVMLSLLPYESLLSIGIFGIIFLLSRYVSLGSLCGGLTLSLIVAVERYVLVTGIADVYVVLSFLLTLTIFVTHRQNIARLFSGTESKAQLGKNKERAGSNV